MKKEQLHEKLDFDNIRHLIEWAGGTHSTKYAYSFRNSPLDRDVVKVTFHQLRNEVRSLACEMAAMGCSGKHCALIGRLSYEWALVYFAALSIGAVLVPLDKDWHATDLAETAKKAGAEFLFCDEDIAEKAAVIEEALDLASDTVYMLAKNKDRNIKTLTALGSMKFQRDASVYFDTPIDTERLALLVFTSGTTGKGKGVMLTQKAILSNMTSALPYIDYSDKTVGVLPPHHTYCSTIMFAAHAMIGAEIYVSSGLRYITAELKEQKPGHLVLVPLYLETFFRKIMTNAKKQGKDETLLKTIKLSNSIRKVGIDNRKLFFKTVREAFGGNLKTVISGGAPINPEILDFFEAIGIQTLNGYGITECAPLISVNHSKNVIKGSVGTVIDVDTVKIAEPNEDGEGEILVKGPNVMLGYYGDDEATNEAFDEDGYFRTGDYGKLDKNNVLYITGRKKNLIILSNGKNVYPEEIENEFTAIPGILEIVVYEGQSKRGNEHNAIVAEIYPDYDYCKKNGIEDVKAYLKEYVDKYNLNAIVYKRIKLIKLRKEEFPKNTLKKIQRFKLDMSIE